MKYASLGTDIRAARKKKKLSQAKLAKLSGLDQAYLSALELGKTNPSKKDISLLEQIIDNLDAEGIAKLKKKKVVHRLGKRSYTGIVSWLPSEPLTYQSRGLTAISLFSGCGGMCLGFAQAGFEILGYVEIDECFRKIYELNFPKTRCLGTDITKISNQEIASWGIQPGSLDILFGGPPCQGFSLAGKRDVYDPRNQLFNDMARIAKLLKPRFVVLENVRLLTSMRAPDGSFIKDHIRAVFEDAGYDVDYKELNARDFGVPQCRERVFFVGQRIDLPRIKERFPTPVCHSHFETPLHFDCSMQRIKTFRDATEDLELIGPGEYSRCDSLHFGVNHPPHVLEWLRHTPEGCSAHDNKNPIHRPPSGYNTTYKRLRWDEPCGTIQTTFAMVSACRTIHPSQHRSLTIREAMRCQTFPDNFRIVGPLGKIRSAIGNAVPPLLAFHLGQHLVKQSEIFLSKIRVVNRRVAYKSSQPVG